jgi:putative transcriptional regulator
VTPHHHLPADLLSAYAAGTVDDAEALFVATHLSLCPACRAEAARSEEVGGALFFASAPTPTDALDAVLARLDEPPPAKRRPPAPTRPDDLPGPLRAVCGPLDQVVFRSVAPRISRFDLPQSSPGRMVALVALQPGAWVPEHHHEHTERTLVLTGGYTSDLGHFVRGDIELRTADDAHPHQQVIDPGETCVVLAVDDGAKLPVSLPGQLMGWLFDR